MKTCPHCAEEVQDTAVLCKHCGKKFAQEKEETLFNVRPGMFKSYPVSFIFGVLAIITMKPFLMLIGVFMLILIWVICSQYKLTVTTKRSTMRKGIFMKHTSEVMHPHIRNVQVRQSIMQRLFKVGNLGISSSAQSDIEIVCPGIDEPYKIKAMIDQYRDMA